MTNILPKLDKLTNRWSNNQRFIITLAVFLLVIAAYGLIFIAPINPIKQVEISNITDSSLAITWLTDSSTNGAVVISRQQLPLGRVGEFLFCRFFGSFCQIYPDEIINPSPVHLAVLKNLAAETNYYYRIYSKGKFWKYDQAGQILPPIKTGPTLDQLNLPRPVFGQIVSNNQALVSLVLYNQARTQVLSNTLISATDNQRKFVIDLGNLRTPDLSQPIAVKSGDLLWLKIVSDQGQTSQYVTYSGQKDLGVIQ